MASLTDGEIERLVENAWRYTPDRMAAYLTRNEEVIEGFGALTTEGGFALAGPYQRPRHVRFLGKTIARAIAQGGGRIVINQPPQTGKSQLVSKWTPTWAQKVTHGRARVLLGSYESSFAATWGRAVRDTVGRYSHELEVKLAKDVTARDEWLTTVGGGMITAGVGTGLTGKPGDIIIVDDPHKDFKDAHSPTKRKDVWNWFNSVVMTRVQPGTTVIVIHTRWHEEDLTGHIFNSPGAEQWTHIRLPAICDAPDDPLGRAIGESIWPERFDEAHYDMVKTSQGLYIWSGMYQQRPSPLEGSIFKKADWRFVDVAPERMLVERNWDFAGTEGAGDWTVGVLLGRHEGHTFILDVFRDQIGDADTERVLLEVARADRDRYGDRYRVRGEQEPGSAGKKLAASYTRLLAGYDVKFETSTGDKVLRARPLAAQQQAGNVSLVRELRDGTYREPSWWAEFIEEFAVFPNNAHDDQVDATSLGFTHLVEDERQPSKVRMSSAAGIRIEPGRPSGRRLPGT